MPAARGGLPIAVVMFVLLAFISTGNRWFWRRRLNVVFVICLEVVVGFFFSPLLLCSLSRQSYR
jgi:hypothetical protein